MYEELSKAEPSGIHHRHCRRCDEPVPGGKAPPNTAAEGTIECKFWGLGGDGTVGANKNSIKIIGDHTDKYVQAYFQYDSKKTGGVTISHLRFGDKPIKSPYYINKADFVACHNPSYITKGYKMVQDVKPGGVFLINCQWSFEELGITWNAEAKRYIAKTTCSCTPSMPLIWPSRSAWASGPTPSSSPPSSLAKVMPEAEAIGYMKDAAEHSLPEEGPGRGGEELSAIDAGATAYVKIDVPAAWAEAVDAPAEEVLVGDPATVKLVKNVLTPVDKMDGDSLPVSAFRGLCGRPVCPGRFRL